MFHRTPRLKQMAMPLVWTKAYTQLSECFRSRACMRCIRVLMFLFLCAEPSTTATSRPIGLDKWGPVLAERYWGPLPPMRDSKSGLESSWAGRTGRPGMPVASKASASTKPPLPIASPSGSPSSPPRKASSSLGASSRECLLSVRFPCLPHMPSLLPPRVQALRDSLARYILVLKGSLTLHCSHCPSSSPRLTTRDNARIEPTNQPRSLTISRLSSKPLALWTGVLKCKLAGGLALFTLIPRPRTVSRLSSKPLTVWASFAVPAELERASENEAYDRRR